MADVALHRPCTSSSPPLSLGVGTAFQCQGQEGHVGSHTFNLTWFNNDRDQLGTVEVRWG